jgi:hypothetical protein
MKRRAVLWALASATLTSFRLPKRLAKYAATGETALSFVPNHIRRQFGVSAEVIAKRLRVEKLWPPN